MSSAAAPANPAHPAADLQEVYVVSDQQARIHAGTITHVRQVFAKWQDAQRFVSNNKGTFQITKHYLVQ